MFPSFSETVRIFIREGNQCASFGLYSLQNPLSVTGLASETHTLPLPSVLLTLNSLWWGGVLGLFGCVSSIAAHYSLHARSKPPRGDSKDSNIRWGAAIMIPLEGEVRGGRETTSYSFPGRAEGGWASQASPSPWRTLGGADGSKTRRSVTGSTLPQDFQNNTSFIVKGSGLGWEEDVVGSK